MKLSCFPDLLFKISPGLAFNKANTFCAVTGENSTAFLDRGLEPTEPDWLNRLQTEVCVVATAACKAACPGTWSSLLPFPALGSGVCLWSLLVWAGGLLAKIPKSGHSFTQVS